MAQIEPRLSRWSYARILLGAFILTPFGSVSTIWANFSVYVISYFHFRVGEDVGDSATWVVSSNIMAFNLGVFLCEKVSRLLGFWITLVGQALICSGALFLSFLTIGYSFVMMTLTFSFLSGLACGIGYALGLRLVITFTSPEQLGKACCGLFSCHLAGSILMNLVITNFINPSDLAPDVKISNKMLFSHSELLNRVPYVFLINGAIVLLPNICAFGLIHKQPQDDNGNRVSESVVKTQNLPQKKNAENATKLSQNNEIPATSLQKSCESTFLTKNMSPEKNNNNDGLLNQPKNNENAAHSLDLSPKDALKLKEFYVLFVFSFCIDSGYVIMATYYKLFGMLYYQDDIFFTKLSVASSLVNFITTNLSGIASDKLGVKKTALMCSSCMTIAVSFLYVSVFTKKSIYAFFVATGLGLNISCYVLIPLCSVYYFGKTHGTTICGMVMSAVYLSNTLTPLAVEYIISSSGWWPLFLSLNILCVLCFLVVLLGLPILPLTTDDKTNN